MRVRPPSQWSRLARCASTNDEAQKLARAGAEEGTVVTAAEQTRGRGRLGRSWHSPADENLYMSVVLRPPLAPHKAPLLCLCAGLAMYEAACALVDENRTSADDDDARLRLKWPNDLLGARVKSQAPWRKLGGVLTELCCVGMRVVYVIVGVGCNIGGREFPAAVEATSLRLLTHADLAAAATVERFGERFLVALAAHYERYLQEGAPPIIELFCRAAQLGPSHPRVIVKTSSAGADPTRELAGIPVGLGPDGELLLEVDSGELVTVLTGDVALASSVAA